MLKQIPISPERRKQLTEQYRGFLSAVRAETGENFVFVYRTWNRANRQKTARRTKVERALIAELNRRISEAREPQPDERATA